MEPCDGNILHCLEEESMNGVVGGGAGSGSLHVGVATAIVKALALQLFQRSFSATATPATIAHGLMNRLWSRALSWDGVPITLELIIEVYTAQQYTMRITYGTFAVMLWDMFLTFSDEVICFLL
jgi:hypothetical protein